MSLKKYPEKIDSILDTVLQERGYLSICKEYDVISQWKDIVGDKVASVTQCDRIENGTLFIRVTSASWRQEIVYLKKLLLEKIRSKSDCKSIKNIVIF
jgi:hypothetical protein